MCFSQKIRKDSFSVFRKHAKVFAVPVVRHEGHDHLVNKNEDADAKAGLMLELDHNVHGQVDEDLGEEVRAGHILKQSTIGQQMLAILHHSCMKRKR